jgi:mRNA-degrading endonuclease RelE of RelBE toxin-antitoxin system
LRFTVFTRRAKDLRPIPRGDAQRRRQAIVGLERGAQADVRALKGRAPWLRMRVGDYRLLFRRLHPEEVRDLGREGAGFLVARIVNRRDLELAVQTL